MCDFCGKVVGLLYCMATRISRGILVYCGGWWGNLYGGAWRAKSKERRAKQEEERSRKSEERSRKSEERSRKSEERSSEE
jgi:hypothetical protein